MSVALGFVHRFIPSSGGNGSPVLLLLHGTGGDEQDLIPIGQALSPGAAILSPRGKVLERGMPRFFRRVAEGVFDVDDLKFRTHELAKFIEDAKREYSLEGRIFAVGYSNGANIAASLMLLHPYAIAGAILFRAMVPFIPDSQPDLKGTAVILAAARKDEIVHPSQTAKLTEILQDAGASVSHYWHQGGHALGQDDIDAGREWLAGRVSTASQS
jgi:phospholipase/carboxylesterase/glyoxalase family protein